MLRRKLSLLLVTAATLAIAACADITAPKQDCVSQQGAGICTK